MFKHNFEIKIANTESELEEVCRLNHETFSEEIAQHDVREDGILIDKFHSENTYIICKKEGIIVAMIAVRAKRPFSLDFKLENLDSYLPVVYKSPAEIRLLSVKPAYRRSRVVYYLFDGLFAECMKQKYDILVMSGILNQQKLYANVGFVPFGPLVGDDVKFQPMYTTMDIFYKSKYRDTFFDAKKKYINLMPGPVVIKKHIQDEYTKQPESHRSDLFANRYRKICSSLSDLVYMKHAQILTGSGTLGNDVVFAHISTLKIPGMILSNGEFGDRSIQQANRYSLEFVEHRKFFEEFDINEINSIIDSNPQVKWLYFVHCETSAGILNDIDALISICEKRNILIFVDCISSFGIIPLNLSKVYMAVASSGKAIGTYSGLSIVFYNSLLEPIENKIPIYLDIHHYIKKAGIPFTINSNILYSLDMAILDIDIQKKYGTLLVLSNKFKESLNKIAPNLLVKGKSLHPSIFTAKIDSSLDSKKMGMELTRNGILVNYNSQYLLNNNMIQFCIFSEVTEEELSYVSETFKKILNSDIVRK